MHNCVAYIITNNNDNVLYLIQARGLGLTKNEHKALEEHMDNSHSLIITVFFLVLLG